MFAAYSIPKDSLIGSKHLNGVDSRVLRMYEQIKYVQLFVGI